MAASEMSIVDALQLAIECIDLAIEQVGPEVRRLKNPRTGEQLTAAEYLRRLRSARMTLVGHRGNLRADQVMRAVRKGDL